MTDQLEFLEKSWRPDDTSCHFNFSEKPPIRTVEEEEEEQQQP